MIAAVICGVILLANLAVLGLSLKLYTEILKDQNMNRRTAHGIAAAPEKGQT
jgi:hypothetical protein